MADQSSILSPREIIHNLQADRLSSNPDLNPEAVRHLVSKIRSLASPINKCLIALDRLKIVGSPDYLPPANEISRLRDSVAAITVDPLTNEVRTDKGVLLALLAFANKQSIIDAFVKHSWPGHLRGIMETKQQVEDYIAALKSAAAFANEKVPELLKSAIPLVEETFVVAAPKVTEKKFIPSTEVPLSTFLIGAVANLQILVTELKKTGDAEAVMISEFLNELLVNHKFPPTAEKVTAEDAKTRGERAVDFFKRLAKTFIGEVIFVDKIETVLYGLGVLYKDHAEDFTKIKTGLDLIKKYANKPHDISIAWDHIDEIGGELLARNSLYRDLPGRARFAPG